MIAAAPIVPIAMSGPSWIGPGLLSPLLARRNSVLGRDKFAVPRIAGNPGATCRNGCAIGVEACRKGLKTAWKSKNSQLISLIAGNSGAADPFRQNEPKCQSRIRNVTYSALMFASLMILAYFAISSSIYFAK
jgi:hypothetical protein